MILNVHRKKTPNRGDLASAPGVYFNSIDDVIFVDVMECDGRDERINSLLSRAEVIIYGGGGLLDHVKFDDSLRYILDNHGDKTVIWGAGSNSIKSQPFVSDLTLARYVGVRDFGNDKDYDWLPCVSCMSTDFEKVLENRRKLYVGGIGILENNSGSTTASVKDLGYNVRKFGNKKVSTAEMLEFIISCDYLISSSFHACYWATLLGVPVVGVPTSSKFHTFKHRIPLSNSGNWNEYLDQTVIYNGALNECREANIDFLNRISHISKSLSTKFFKD